MLSFSISPKQSIYLSRPRNFLGILVSLSQSPASNIPAQPGHSEETLATQWPVWAQIKMRQHIQGTNHSHDCRDTIPVYQQLVLDLAHSDNELDAPSTSPFSLVRAAFICSEHRVNPYITVWTRWQNQFIWTLWTVVPALDSIAVLANVNTSKQTGINTGGGLALSVNMIYLFELTLAMCYLTRTTTSHERNDKYLLRVIKPRGGGDCQTRRC